MAHSDPNQIYTPLSPSRPRTSATATATTTYIHRNPYGVLNDPLGPARILAYICTTSADNPRDSNNTPSPSSTTPSFPHLTITETLYLHVSAAFATPLATVVSSLAAALFRRHRVAIRGPDIRLNLRFPAAAPPTPTVFGRLRLMRAWMMPLTDLREDEFREMLRGIAACGGVAEVVVLLPPCGPPGGAEEGRG